MTNRVYILLKSQRERVVRGNENSNREEWGKETSGS